MYDLVVAHEIVVLIDLFFVHRHLFDPAHALDQHVLVVRKVELYGLQGRNRIIRIINRLCVNSCAHVDADDEIGRIVVAEDALERMAHRILDAVIDIHHGEADLWRMHLLAVQLHAQDPRIHSSIVVLLSFIEESVNFH